MIIVSYYACDFSDMGRQNNTQFSSISFIKMPFFFCQLHTSILKESKQMDKLRLLFMIFLWKKNIV